MATPLESKQPCVDCGSSDALHVYQRDDDTVFSLCYSCKAVHNLDGPRITAPVLKGSTKLKRLDDFEKGAYKSIRDINAASLQFYDARIVGDEIFFPYRNGSTIEGFKVRDLAEKKFYIDGSIAPAGLYGMDKFSKGGKAVTITEGEFDAMAAFQMQGSKYPCVSVRNGVTGAVKDCQQHYDWLDSFDSIYICFDGDDPGRKEASKVAELFGPKAKIMRHLPGCKDANDYLMQGKSKEFTERWWQSEVFEPDGIICTADLWDIVSTPLHKSPVEYPFSGLNRMTYGIRPQELVTISAGSGLGKSQMLRELVWHIKNKTEDNIGMLFLEEGKRKTTEALMSLAANKPLHLPQEFLTKEEEEAAMVQRREAFDIVHGDRRLYLYDYFGSDKLEHIVSKLRYLAKARNCKYIFLDHITILTSSQEYGDERKLIDEIMTKLRMFVQETGVALFVVSHLKRPDGKGHEEGAVTSLAQLRGSASIAQLSDIVIGLERNGQAEDELLRNTTFIRVLKNRFCGLTGPCGAALYNKDTGRMLELLEEEL